MSVYVDELCEQHFHSGKWKHGQSCHLMATTEAELEEIARRLQLRKDWRHGDHYDLTANKRRLAVELGAIEITSRWALRTVIDRRKPKKERV